MNDSVFLDTNVLCYAILKSQDLRKHNQARSLMENTEHEVLLSTQQRNGFDDNVIQLRINDILLSCVVNTVSLQEIRLAWQLKVKYQLSYWDSLIMASALNHKCHTLYTEDLHHGLVVDNQLHVINPFK